MSLLRCSAVFSFALALAAAAVATGCDSADEARSPVERELAPTGVATPAASTQQFAPLQAIVKWKEGAAPRAGVQLAGVERVDALPLAMSLVRFDATTAAAKQDALAATWDGISALQARDDVEYVHPNWAFQLSDVPTVPNDFYYPWQWHYPKIQLPLAWTISKGTPTTRIAILDTGRSAHPELNTKWVPGLEYDAAHQDGDATADSSGSWRHGIHVAGIAAGRTNDNNSGGNGTAGVCWECQILNVKVADGNAPPGDPTIYLDTVIRGINWSVENGAQVINMSFELGGAPCSDTSREALSDAIVFAGQRNVSVVAAAGNAASDVANTVPASCPDVISVAATTNSATNNLAPYSNYGDVTLAAPGGFDIYGAGIGCPADEDSQFTSFTTGVVSTWVTSPASGGVACYRYLGGTSMAAPHVAGVIGLMVSRNPSLTPKHIREILVKTAIPIDSCAGQCGAGLVDAYNAVWEAAPRPVADAPPSSNFTFSCSGLTCTFNGASSTDDHGIIAYQWTLPGQQRRTGSSTSFFVPGYGSHTVKLRVTDTTGQSNEISKVVTPSPPSVTPLAGSYDNPARSGNSLSLFKTTGGDWLIYWYTFQTNGDPVWYLSGVAAKTPSRWTAPLYRVTWNGTSTSAETVGNVALDFSTASSAWFSWTLTGTPGNISGGEPFTYRFGGNERSGAWHVPTQAGWGIQVQESGTRLDATVAFFRQGQPQWMSGRTTPGSNLSIALSHYAGPGLCPSCGGSTPSVAQSAWSSSSMTLQIANGASTTGAAATNIYVNGPPATGIWVRPLQAIELLTAP